MRFSKWLRFVSLSLVVANLTLVASGCGDGTTLETKPLDPSLDPALNPKVTAPAESEKVVDPALAQ